MTRREDIVKVQGHGCCPLKGLSNLIVGLQHVLSCTHFLQQTLHLEQLLLTAAGTGPSLSCQAGEETVVQNCHRGTAPLPQEAWASSTPFPFSFQSITSSSSRRYSPRCLHQVSLEVFLWEGRLEAFTVWLAFLHSASVSWQGCGCSPSGRKIRKENAFEIPSLLKDIYLSWAIVKLFTVYIASVILVSSFFSPHLSYEIHLLTKRKWA